MSSEGRGLSGRIVRRHVAARESCPVCSASGAERPTHGLCAEHADGTALCRRAPAADAEITGPDARPRLTITLGRGVDRPIGRSATVTGIDELVAALEAHTGHEAWWSGSAFVGGHRSAGDWRGASVLVAEVDTAGHGPVDDDLAAQLEVVDWPGTAWHRSPAGARVIVVLAEPIEDLATCRLALAGLARLVAQAVAGLPVTVDISASTDPARLWYGPRATAKGVVRDAQIHVLRRDPIAVAELIAHAPAIDERPPPSRAADSRFSEAVAAWHAERPPVSWRRPRRECPACGHRGCFGALPADPSRWFCFSADHAADSTVDGRPCGRPSATMPGAYWGDTLDLEAHRRRQTVAATLREDGHDPDEPATIPEPEQGEVERLSLGDARERVRELLDDAAARGVSIDLVGTAGTGKSTAAVEAEVDRLLAWAVDHDGGDRAPPLSIIAVGAGRGLALERLAMVRELVGDAEIEVRLGLGRQPLEDDGSLPPQGFACAAYESVAPRVRLGLAGCHGCPHAQTCVGTPGHYLHGWAGVAATAKAGPTMIVCPVAALPTVWSRGTRRTTGIRVVLDDAPDLHAGHLLAIDIDSDTRGLATTTAALGRRIVRSTGIEQLVGESIDRVAMTGRHVADPAIVAAVASLLLPALRRDRDALGRRLARLVRIPTIAGYAAGFPLGRRDAARLVDERGPSWLGIGVCAALWSLLREAVSHHGALPVVTGGAMIQHVDHHLLGLPRTRLGVARLALARELRIDEQHEIVVDTGRDVVAATPPVAASWGDRGRDRDTLADRYADAAIEDLHAAHGTGLVVVAGKREEARAPEDCRVAVAGRDDRATNGYADATALVLRRLAPPFGEVADTVAAVLAGTGWVDELPASDLPTGLTPSGARLPVDDRVRTAWLEQRAAATRNGLGRARAAHRQDAIALVALDQDLPRWPWLAPEYRIRSVPILELGAALGIRTPRILTVDAERRAKADTDPTRTAARRAAIEAVDPAGRLSSRAVGELTGLPEQTVRRLRPARGGDPLAAPLKRAVQGGSERITAAATLEDLARLPAEDVPRLAARLGKAVRTVRDLRASAAMVVSAATPLRLDPRRHGALDRALAALAELRAPAVVEVEPDPVQAVRASVRRCSAALGSLQVGPDGTAEVDSWLAAELRAIVEDWPRVIARASPEHVPRALAIGAELRSVLAELAAAG